MKMQPMTSANAETLLAPPAPAAARRVLTTGQRAPIGRTDDQVHLSPASLQPGRRPESGAARDDLIARVRTEIATGRYMSPEKLEAAVSRLLEEIAGGG